MEGDDPIGVVDDDDGARGNVEVIDIEEKTGTESKGEESVGEELEPLLNPLTEHRTIHIDRDPVFIHISDLHIRSPRFFRNDKRWYATKNLFRYFTEEYCTKEVFVIITGNVTNSPLVNMNLFINAARTGIKETIAQNDPMVLKGGIQLSHFHIFSCAGTHDCYGFGYIDISKRSKGKFEGYNRQDLVDPVWIEINHTRYDNVRKKRKYHLISLDSTEEQSDPFTSMGRIGNRQLAIFRQIVETIRAEDLDNPLHDPKSDKIFTYLHHNPFTELIELSLKLRLRMQRIIDEVQEGGFFHFKQDMMLMEDGDELLDILDTPDPRDRIDCLLFGHCHLYMDLIENKKFEKGSYEPMNEEHGTEEEEMNREYKESYQRIVKYKIIGEINTTGGCYKDPESGNWVTSYSEYKVHFGKRKKPEKPMREEEEEGEGDGDISKDVFEDSSDDDDDDEEKKKKESDGYLEYKHVVGVPVLSPAEYALGTFGCCNIL